MRKYFARHLEKLLKVKRKTFFYWEKVGKVPKARRTRMGNYRYWNEQEIKRLKRIIIGRE